MLFKDFAECLYKIEQESSRNKKTEILANFLNELSYDEYKSVAYLLNGRVVPVFVSLEYNFSLKLLQRSVGNIINDIDKVQEMYSEKGDMGDVIESLMSEDSKDLEINKVFEELKSIAMLEGKGSQDMKISNVSKLLVNLSPISGKYVGRMVLGKLRLGINHRTVLDAISWALKGDKSLRKILDRAYGIRSDLGSIMEISFSESAEENLANLEAQVGLPMASKLVEREKSVSKIYQRLGDCIIQPKYDGLRAQIHFKRGGLDIAELFKIDSEDQINISDEQNNNVSIYSRNMESLTEMFPDIVQKMNTLDVDEIILDSEVIGYDSINQKYMSFQDTIQRKRKYRVQDKANEIPIKVIIFDCLYLNGSDLTNEPLVYRIKKLNEVIKDDEMLNISENYQVTSEEDLAEKFNEYMSMNLEGLIAKNKLSTYEPGTRNYEWIKLKVRTEAGSVDSLDLVILGYYKGTGTRARFGIGALLAGIYDQSNDNFLAMTKIGTGITDQGWIDIKKELDKYKLNQKPQNVTVTKVLYPDIWVEPSIVSVVEFDEITKSSNYTMKNSSEGYSLRFPRLKQFGRDKSSTDASTFEEVDKMYRLQFE